MLGWFDTHIHLQAPEWNEDPPTVCRRVQSQGVSGLLMPGVRVSEWSCLLTLAQQLPGVYFAPGLHPAYARQWDNAAAEQLTALTREAQVLALGEIGLDGTTGPSLAEQEAIFRAQLRIALEAGLPVLLHSRKSIGRMVEILRELAVGQQIGGIWHAFSGSVEIARELVRLGFKIGVGPILLRANARKLPQAVRELPDAALVLETDAPDMTADPAGLIRVAEKLAELKGWTMEETARITTANAREVLSFGEPCQAVDNV